MDRKDKYPEIERRQDILSLAISQSSEGIAMVDLKGTVLYVNEAFAEMHGYAPKDILGKNLSIFHTSDQMPSVGAANRKIKEKGYFKGEIWHKRLDGSVFPTIMHNSLVHDGGGKPISIIATMRDITEQRLAEEALLDSEIKHKTLVNNIPGMIYRSYPDWSAEVINGSENICGYTEKELNSQVNKWLDIIHPEDKERILKEGSGLAKVKKNLVQTYRIKKKGGDIRWVEDRKTSIFSEKGEFVGIDGVIFDITERKQLEQELLEAKTVLEETVKERTAELNEKNITLKVLLDQRGMEKKHLEELIMSNVKKLVIPNINRLKKSALSSKQQTALTILEANLNEIISPFSKTIDSKYMKLTPTEIQVANHIKHGSSSKDISESLALSQRTVDTHRYNIRKKLGISGKGVNLRTYLSSI